MSTLPKCGIKWKIQLDTAIAGTAMLIEARIFGGKEQRNEDRSREQHRKRSAEAGENGKCWRWYEEMHLIGLSEVRSSRSLYD